MKTIDNKFDTRLSNALLINGSELRNLGLLNGKMGIAILFYIKGRKEKRPAMEIFASELIDDIMTELHSDTPPDFENGLAGIGCGVEYLAQNGYIESNTDVILEEMDLSLSNLDYSNMSDLGLCRGLIGYGCYFLARVRATRLSNDSIAALLCKSRLASIVNCILAKIDPSTLVMEPNRFIIHWDLTVLLWFLTECYRCQIARLAIAPLLNDLVTRVTENKHVFKKGYSAALLSCCLLHLKKHFDKRTKADHWLHRAKSRSTLRQISSNAFSIETGRAGIAIVYTLLYLQTNNTAFKRMACECLSDVTSSNIFSDTFRAFRTSNFTLESSLGAFKGIAGPQYLNLFLSMCGNKRFS